MIAKWWTEIPHKFSTVELDAFVIMPNHIHGIIFLNGPDVGVDVGVDLCVNPSKVNPKENKKGRHAGLPEQKFTNRPTLGTIVQWFKTMITNEYIRNVKTNNWEPFHKRLFQRNYYEHIIRNEKSLNRIRHYIMTNPDRWNDDIENPEYLNKKGKVINPKDSILGSYYQSIIKKD